MSRFTRTRQDEGFTMIEVVVSLAVLALVATSGLYFFINGTRNVTEAQRTQNAVSVANEAMELAFSVAAQADEATNMSGLVEGRTQAAVTAAWTMAGTHGVEGLDLSYPVWDASAVAGDPEVVQIARTSEHSGIEYTATTVIGSCFRAPTSDECGRLPGLTVEPATTPGGYTRLMRVMVLVTWPSTGGVCAGGTCTYELTALADPSTDLVWNNTTQPIAVDDVAEVWVGETVEIPVLANDVLPPVQTNPIRDLQMVGGSGTVAQAAGAAVVTFPAPANASGHMTFRYRLQDQAGRMSNYATVLVKVLPRAVDDVAATTSRTPITIPVTANDLGSPASVTILTPPSRGTAQVMGTDIRFSPDNNTGVFTIRYEFVDVSGQTSTQATVTVTSTQMPDPIAQDQIYYIPLSQASTDLDLLARNGNPPTFTVEVMSRNITVGELRVDGAVATNGTRGRQLVYTQPGTQAGVHTFQYRVHNPENISSNTARVTLVIFPDAASFYLKTPTTPDITFSLGSFPSTMFDVQFFEAPLCNDGKIATTEMTLFPRGGGEFTVNSGTVHGNFCTLRYRMVGKGAYAGQQSPIGLITFDLKKK